MKDIRERSWEKNNCDAAKLLNLLIETENLLISLDEYQNDNGLETPIVHRHNNHSNKNHH